MLVSLCLIRVRDLCACRLLLFMARQTRLRPCILTRAIRERGMDSKLLLAGIVSAWPAFRVILCSVWLRPTVSLVKAVGPIRKFRVLILQLCMVHRVRLAIKTTSAMWRRECSSLVVLTLPTFGSRTLRR